MLGALRRDRPSREVKPKTWTLEVMRALGNDLGDGRPREPYYVAYVQKTAHGMTWKRDGDKWVWCGEVTATTLVKAKREACRRAKEVVRAQREPE